MTVLHPEVPEESLPGELERISGFINTAGGEMIETLQDSPWGRRRLAYPIHTGGRDIRDGYYTVWHFNLGPNRVDDLERELKLDTQLIRYIIVTWAPKKLTAKEIEAAEIAAEDAAAAAYAAAQAATAAAVADEAAADEAAAETPAAVDTETAGDEAAVVDAEAAVADAEALTAQAEALEATGAELAIAPAEAAESMAIEPVAAVEEREELEAEAAAAMAQAEAAASAATEQTGDVPAGAIRGDGTLDCPEEYPVKGNADSMLYHIPGSPSYKRTVAELCFASADAAEAAGFSPTKFEAAHEEGE
jgi:ribosomal protein S6